jgi:hypothetical protein
VAQQGAPRWRQPAVVPPLRPLTRAVALIALVERRAAPARVRGVADEDMRAYVAELADTGSFIRRPRGYVGKVRPDVNGASAAGVDLDAIDAWVRARGGEIRTARPPTSGGLRPGRRVAPPPAPPQRYYVLPPDALGAD